MKLTEERIREAFGRVCDAPMLWDFPHEDQEIVCDALEELFELQKQRKREAVTQLVRPAEPLDGEIATAWKRVLATRKLDNDSGQYGTIQSALEELFRLRAIRREMGDSWKVAAEKLKRNVKRGQE